MNLEKRIAEIFKAARKFGLCMDLETATMLAMDAAIAAGVSGGKDSAALSIVLNWFLKEIGHRGRKILIHSDLGLIEHSDSLPAARRLAEKIGWELVVVKPRIDMIGRWYQRHRDNLNRYIDLSCVKMITPWSSSSLRFCSSEMKVAPICSELKRLFPGQPIINAVGIRADESPARAKKPVSKENKKLFVETIGTYGRDWNAIRDFPVEKVWLVQRQENFCGHEAYDRNGNKRVSCSICVLAGIEEIRASLRDERNHEAYRRVVRLEIFSTYSFSQSFYAGDVAPELLTAEMLDGLALAKEKAAQRISIESEITEELLYVKGWPTFQPDREQSALIAGVRDRIGELMNMPVKFTTWRGVYNRYDELLTLKAQKELEKQKKAERSKAKAMQPAPVRTVELCLN